jgi:hypothetical protein
MKESRLLPLLALLILIGALVYSASPKKSASESPSANAAAGQMQTNWSTGNATAANGSNPASDTAAGAPAKSGTTDTANPPAAESNKTGAPSTPEIAPTAPAEHAPANTNTGSTKNTVVEMPATPPEPPKNFYPKDFSTNHINLFDSDSDYYFAVRGGYEHSGYSNDRNTWYAGVKFYAQPDDLRARLGNNGWLIPDAEVEFSHQVLPRPENSAKGGAGDGVQLRADFYWNWVKWTTRVFARENSPCMYARPWTFTLAPLFETGFQKTFEGSAFRSDRYVGARFAINRYAFVQYVFGRTDGFGRVRQEVLGEVPISISHDSQVRYVLRGEWERGDLNYPNFYEAGIFVEMPLGLLVHPRDWHDLIPFVD